MVSSCLDPLCYTTSWDSTQRVGFWGGLNFPRIIEEHLEKMAADGWRLVNVKNPLFPWWLVPLLPQRVTYFWEREYQEYTP